MPQFFLNGPNQERYKLSVPEGTSEDTIKDTLFGGAPETAGLPAENATPTLATERPPQRISIMPGLLSPTRQSPGAPALIRSHLDELTAAHRAGRISNEQLASARQGLGLPAQSVVPSISAAARPATRASEAISREVPVLPRDPERMLRPVNPRTLAEMDAARNVERSRSLNEEQDNLRIQRDIATRVEQQHYTDRLREAEPALRRGPLGGTEGARQLFLDHIAPHVDEKQFATTYFAGMYSPNIKMSTWSNSIDGAGVHFRGPLFNYQHGNDVVRGRVGDIERAIFPETSLAKHIDLELEKAYQGMDIGKTIMRGQLEMYRALGINRIDLSANIDIGGYAWAKYGALPRDWLGLIQDIRDRLPHIAADGKSLAVVERLLSSDDPRSLWVLSDMTKPSQNTRGGPTLPLGKQLLFGQNWQARFDLSDKPTMQRLMSYINR